MNWQVFTHLSTLQVQFHWVAALLSFVFGVFVLVNKKGTSLHRFVGRLFVFFMVVTSVSAFFVRSNYGEPYSLLSGFSWIHLLIPLTLVYLFLGIRAIRQGRVKDHRNCMVATFAGALLIAGAFTFLPGRHMHTFFFGEPSEIQKSIESGAKH